MQGEIVWAIIEVKTFIRRNLFEIVCGIGIVGLIFVAMLGK